MSTTAITNIGTLIKSDNSIRSGRPHIAGTGVSVQRVVEWYKQGESPEEIANNIYGHLSLAQVFAAITYYHANRERIENDIKHDNQVAKKLEKNWQAQSKQ